MPYNREWELQAFPGARSHRRLLSIGNIDFKVRRSDVETNIRAALVTDSASAQAAKFHWAPRPEIQNPEQHEGWVLIEFVDRPQTREAYNDLEKAKLIFRERRAKVEWPSRHMVGFLVTEVVHLAT